jgi:hypothetical protein
MCSTCGISSVQGNPRGELFKVVESSVKITPEVELEPLKGIFDTFKTETTETVGIGSAQPNRVLIQAVCLFEKDSWDKIKTGVTENEAKAQINKLGASDFIGGKGAPLARQLEELNVTIYNNSDKDKVVIGVLDRLIYEYNKRKNTREANKVKRIGTPEAKKRHKVEKYDIVFCQDGASQAGLANYTIIPFVDVDSMEGQITAARAYMRR